MSSFLYNQQGVGVTSDTSQNYYFRLPAFQNATLWCKIQADQTGLLEQVGWKAWNFYSPYLYCSGGYIDVNLYSLSDDESTRTLIGKAGGVGIPAVWYPTVIYAPMQDIINQQTAPHITAGQKYVIEFTNHVPTDGACSIMWMQYYDYSGDPAFQDHAVSPSTYRYRCNIVDVSAGQYNSNINNGAFPYLEFQIRRDGSVDGGWSDWSDWGACDASCGTGQQSRTRTCTNPSPQLDGNACQGDQSQSQPCDSGVPCPINGAWTDWSAWGECSVACGGGTQSRTRTCTNPAPSNGGTECQGDAVQSQGCNMEPCPIPGGWSDWQWSQCSSKCDGGQQVGTRTCNNPLPQHGGQQCTGDDITVQTCNTGACPVPGGWTEWSAWSRCSAKCDGGTQTSTRACTNPAPRNGGADCQGSDTVTAPCNTQACVTERFTENFTENFVGTGDIIAPLFILVLLMILIVATFISLDTPGYVKTQIIMPMTT